MNSNDRLAEATFWALLNIGEPLAELFLLKGFKDAVESRSPDKLLAICAEIERRCIDYHPINWNLVPELLAMDHFRRAIEMARSWIETKKLVRLYGVKDFLEDTLTELSVNELTCSIEDKKARNEERTKIWEINKKESHRIVEDAIQQGFNQISKSHA